MNEYDLFDAFGGVNDALLERSERRPVRRLPLRKALIAAAAVMALAVCFCLSYAERVLRVLEELCERAGIEGEYFAILLRTLAASLVTHLCADLCRDGGSQALAALVEISGAVAALLISLPILEAVTELLLGYFS